MPSYERQTHVRTPLEDLWEFHSRVSGLEALTPAWMGLRVESVIGPDGQRDPEVLEAGSEISMSIHPFGVGPRQYWTSLITERERSSGVAYFRDELVNSPFDHWLHTHTFYADGDTTILRDHVEYELPFGPLGDALGPFSGPGFEAMFRGRHEKTRELLEGGRWRESGRERERERKRDTRV